MKKCMICDSDLVDGPDAERSAERRGMSCRVRGIPTKRCPRGCPGQYWYRLDFGVEALDYLITKSDQVAKRKFGFFKSKQSCRLCSTELIDANKNETFILSSILKKGTPFELQLTVPALRCPTCQKNYIPADTSASDPYYMALGDLIGAAITKDLIWRKRR